MNNLYRAKSKEIRGKIISSINYLAQSMHKTSPMLAETLITWLQLAAQRPQNPAKSKESSIMHKRGTSTALSPPTKAKQAQNSTKAQLSSSRRTSRPSQAQWKSSRIVRWWGEWERASRRKCLLLGMHPSTTPRGSKPSFQWPQEEDSPPQDIKVTRTWLASTKNLKLTSKLAPLPPEQTAAWRDSWEMKREEKKQRCKCNKKKRWNRADLKQVILSSPNSPLTKREVLSRTETSTSFTTIWSSSNKSNRKSLRLREELLLKLNRWWPSPSALSQARNLNKLLKRWRKRMKVMMKWMFRLMKDYTKSPPLPLSTDHLSDPASTNLQFQVDNHLRPLVDSLTPWTDSIVKADQKTPWLSRNSKKKLIK